MRERRNTFVDLSGIGGGDLAVGYSDAYTESLVAATPNRSFRFGVWSIFYLHTRCHGWRPGQQNFFRQVSTSPL